MAGDWIAIRHGLDEEPEVIAMAAALGISEDEVVGKLVRFWTWVDRSLPSGDAASVTEVWIDRHAQRHGFAAALATVGWLEVLATGGVRVPHHDRWFGRNAKTRLQAAQRTREWRSRRLGDQKTGDDSVTLAPSQKHHHRTGQDRTGEKREDPPTPPAGGHVEIAIPDELDTTAFAAAWADWIAYRRERHLAAWQPRTVAAQLERLAALGEAKAIEALLQSIANGWQGVFPPSATNGAAKSYVNPRHKNPHEWPEPDIPYTLPSSRPKKP